MPSPSKLYLFVYNSLQAFGWSIALVRVLISFASTDPFSASYSFAGYIICLLQAASFMEVIHGAIGIVPGGVLLPLMQWGGRTHYLLAIVRRIAEVQDSPSIFATFLAWSISENNLFELRYTLEMGPYSLWLSGIHIMLLLPSDIALTVLLISGYTLFIVIYPVGVAGEMWLMYSALPFVKEKDLYADSFAFLPFSYYNFVQGLLVVYPFLWLKLYLHLFKQRSSKLGKRHYKKLK